MNAVAPRLCAAQNIFVSGGNDAKAKSFTHGRQIAHGPARAWAPRMTFHAMGNGCEIEAALETRLAQFLLAHRVFPRQESVRHGSALAQDCHGAPNSQWPWGPWLFQHAVKLALKLVQTAQDQGETVGGGHWGRKRPQPLTAGAS
jgi:hypothetical protein